MNLNATDLDKMMRYQNKRTAGRFTPVRNGRRFLRSFCTYSKAHLMTYLFCCGFSDRPSDRYASRQPEQPRDPGGAQSNPGRLCGRTRASELCRDRCLDLQLDLRFLAAAVFLRILFNFAANHLCRTAFQRFGIWLFDWHTLCSIRYTGAFICQCAVVSSDVSWHTAADHRLPDFNRAVSNSIPVDIDQFGTGRRRSDQTILCKVFCFYSDLLVDRPV